MKTPTYLILTISSILFSLLLNTISYCQIENYPKGTPPTEWINSFKKHILENKFQSAVHDYFGPIYDPSLCDLVCYIDSQDSVHIGMTDYGKKEKRKRSDYILWGEKKIFILVFSENDLNDKEGVITKEKYHTQYLIRDSSSVIKQNKIDTTLNIVTKKGPVAFNATRKILQYQPEPSQYSLNSLIRSLGGLFTSGAVSLSKEEKVSIVKDSVMTLQLECKDDNVQKMYVTQTPYAFDIPINSKNRIVFRSEKKDRVKLIAYNFGNFEKTRLAISLGAGINSTLAKPHPTPGNVFKLYAFGNYYLKRPQLPVRAWSIALTLGTNLTSNPLSDLVYGFRFGSTLGIITGGNWQLNKDNNKRTSNIFIGIDYKL